MKYGKWLRIWYKNYVEPSSKSKTRDRYYEVIEKRLIPNFGDCEMAELTPVSMQKYVAELLRTGNGVTGKGLSPNTVNGIITVMQNSLKFACLLGEIEEYEAGKIKRPKKTEKTVTCFTLQEQKKIEKAVSDSSNPSAFGVILCLYSGLRIGELLALTWNDLDLKRGLMSVDKSCHDGKNDGGEFCRIIEDPKTRTSKRVIPLPKQIIPTLKNAKKTAKSKWVITAKNGRPISVRAYQYAFTRLLKMANIERKGFHALRHTFATRALECNMDIKTLSEILGHKNASVTLNRYAHSMMEHKAQMMNRIGRLL